MNPRLRVLPCNKIEAVLPSRKAEQLLPVTHKTTTQLEEELDTMKITPHQRAPWTIFVLLTACLLSSVARSVAARPSAHDE